MRLDKYLKVSRLIKRRTVANEACDNERVTVNGKVARASYEVKVGDVIAIRFGERTLTVEVLAVQETFLKVGADQLHRQENQRQRHHHADLLFGHLDRTQQTDQQCSGRCRAEDRPRYRRRQQKKYAATHLTRRQYRRFPHTLPPLQW